MAAACSSLALGGCGGATDDLPRQAVSGRVTLDGKPLARASIAFNPEANSPNAVAVGGTVSNGSYSIPKASGPTPGTYRVTIFAGSEEDGAPRDEAPGMPPKPVKDPVPAKYNVQTTLKATVAEGQSNTFDFELDSKP